MTLYRSFGKRGLDLLLVLVSVPLVLVVALLVALIVRYKLGSPVLYVQTRPGVHGEPFRLYKFRTMTNATNTQGQSLPDAERLTPFGAFLRRTSLDELPELWNVFKGEMSLVGPRPLLMQYLPLYSPEQARRHEVRPGLTGLAQVNGRNALSWEEKFQYDVEYVDRQRLLLDLKILLMTITKIVQREGISQPGQATATPFLGNVSK